MHLASSSILLKREMEYKGAGRVFALCISYDFQIHKHPTVLLPIGNDQKSAFENAIERISEPIHLPSGLEYDSVTQFPDDSLSAG